MDQSNEEYAKAEIRRFTSFLRELQITDYDWHTRIGRKFIQIQNEYFYDTEPNVIQSIHSGNAVIDKCIMTFSALILEVDILMEKARSIFYNALIIYGEDVDGCLLTENGSVKMIAQFLPQLQQLYVFTSRCNEVFHNIISQFDAFLTLKDNILEHAMERKLMKMWRSLGLLLSILISLDEIVRQQSTLQQHWQTYYKRRKKNFRAMQLIGCNPSQYDAESDLLQPLLRLITSIDRTIMQANLYKNCCQQMFERNIHENNQLNERMKGVVIEMFERWDQIANDLPDKRNLMVIIALAICHMYIFRTVDKKMMRTIWNCYKRLPQFHLYGYVIWSPCEFMLKNFTKTDRIIDKKMIAAMMAAKLAQFTQNMELLPREATNAASILDEWKCEMNEKLKEISEQMTMGQLTQKISLFLRGVRYADLLCRLLKNLLTTLVVEQKAIPRSSASAAFRLIEIIKEIESIFWKWWYEILEICQEAIQYYSAKLIYLIGAVYQTIRNESDFSYRTVDTLSALSVARNALSGSILRTNLIVAGTALDMTCYAKIFRGNDAEKIDELFVRMETLSTLGNIILRTCNCSFLFWHRSFIAAYFSAIIEDSNSRPQLFFDAINDIEPMLGSDDNDWGVKVKESVREELYELYEKLYLKKLCEAVETDLRLSVHAHLQLDDRKPNDPIHDTNMRLVHLLQMPTVRLFDRLIDVKRYVERYLESTFYNLTAVALHDSNTYMTMSLLAKQKYNLILCQSRLPFQKLDQGPDVLFIARNIDSFVKNYDYNLNEQFFIEKDSTSKQLTIVTVEHVANSIRTHGMGIMHTAINYAYQFLKKKFYLFSQFLYDDRIRNQLMKDERYFQENAEKLGKLYPVNRAKRFSSAIRFLGVADDDDLYLDELRILITEIGNVMGYVRLVRSGGVEASMQSLAFLPNLDDIPSFEPFAVNSKLSSETIDAARILDNVFDMAKKNVNQSDNYLKILVDAFAPELCDSMKYEHLNYFYMIIPPLTIKYVDRMLSCKGKLGRKAKQNNTFTDDGFILGVAFILVLLNQHAYFSSLNWFHSVVRECEEEISNASLSSKGSAGKNALDPSTAIRLTKLKQYQKEFQLLSYTFSSAKIFFNSS